MAGLHNGLNGMNNYTNGLDNGFNNSLNGLYNSPNNGLDTGINIDTNGLDEGKNGLQVQQLEQKAITPGGIGI